jgi:hypothetical protein
MRQVWKRASSLRFFLVVAATSVITLAASGPIHSAVSGRQASVSVVARTGGTSTGSAECSTAEALAVATRLNLVPDPTLDKPVARVLCGAFTGPESEAMVAVFARATCLPNYGWALFSFSGGAWQLAANGSHPGFVIDLVAVGPDLRETVPIWRQRDLHCFPTGGTRARTWHWDGSRLVAGSWTQVTKGEPRARGFYSPSKNIYCGMSDNSMFRGADCYSYVPPQKAVLNAAGRVTICRDRGSRNRCNIGNPGEGTPKLRYGRQITVGRFRCRSRISGVRCTVIRSGRGFLINRSGVSRVGP